MSDERTRARDPEELQDDEPSETPGPVSTGSDPKDRPPGELDEAVHEASEESFPASDPPAY